MLSGTAFAADATISASPVPPGSQTFAQLDTNRDGQLSFSEARLEASVVVR
jgi:hypothetical protein